MKTQDRKLLVCRYNCIELGTMDGGSIIILISWTYTVYLIVTSYVLHIFCLLNITFCFAFMIKCSNCAPHSLRIARSCEFCDYFSLVQWKTYNPKRRYVMDARYLPRIHNCILKFRLLPDHLCSSPDACCLSYQIKEDKIGGACSLLGW